MLNIMFQETFIELRRCDYCPISQMGKPRHRKVELIKQWNWVSSPCLSKSKGHLCAKKVMLGGSRPQDPEVTLQERGGRVGNVRRGTAVPGRPPFSAEALSIFSSRGLSGADPIPININLVTT